MQRGKIGGRKSLETGFIAVDSMAKGWSPKNNCRSRFRPKVTTSSASSCSAASWRRLGRKRGALESGPQHRVGQQIKRPRQVRRQHFDGEPEAVVSRDRIKRPADLLDGPRDLAAVRRFVSLVSRVASNSVAPRRPAGHGAGRPGTGASGAGWAASPRLQEEPAPLARVATLKSLAAPSPPGWRGARASRAPD